MSFEKIRSGKFGKYFDKLFLLFKYGLSSGTAFVIDMLFFALFVRLFEKTEIANYVALATLAARVVSCTYTFFINKFIVFKKKKETGSSPVKFAVLCIFSACASAFLTNFFTLKLGAVPVIVKLFVDTGLFFFNFFVQKVWVFK